MKTRKKVFVFACMATAYTLIALLVGDDLSTTVFFGEESLIQSSPFMAYNQTTIGNWKDVNQNDRMSLLTNSREKDTHNLTCRLSGGKSTWSVPVFPNLIIIGAQKAGTTALGHFLRKVPTFLRSKEIEAHFWDYVAKDPKNWSSTGKRCDLIKLYHNCWDSDLIVPGTITFEKTPSLLASPKKARVIRSILHPHIPKILIILRDPIARFYSQYEMNRLRSNQTIPSVEEIVKEEVEKLRNYRAIDVPSFQRGMKWNQSDFMIPRNSPLLSWTRSLLQRGFYAPQVAKYMQFFPLGVSLKVIQYENFTRNKFDGLNDILEWVGGPPHNLTQNELNKDLAPYKNRNKGSSRATDDEVSAYLKHLYKPFNDKLSDLLGEEWLRVWDDSD